MGIANAKYLWTIDNRGINVAREQTPFATKRGFIVHSNISSAASIGGEAWFTGPGEVTINAGSGRYGYNGGASGAQWLEAISYWRGLGYKVTRVPFKQR